MLDIRRIALLAAAFLALAAPSQSLAAGKTLNETLSIVRASLAGQGEISYSIKMHDSADGSNWSQSMTGQASNIKFDAANCTLSYHWRTSSDGKQVQDFESTWYLAKGRKVSLATRAEEIRAQAANGGHKTWTAVVSPSIWVVTLTFADTSAVANFKSKEKAEKFMRAVNHAMELCGADMDF